MRCHRLVPIACALVLGLFGDGLAGDAAGPHLQWSRQMPPRKPMWDHHAQHTWRDMHDEPVVAGGKVLIACAHNGALLALDLASGQEAWRFYTNSPLRFPPAADGDRLFLGGSDGYVRCLDVATGKERWKTFLGQSGRLQLAHECLASPWAIHTGLATDGASVYGVAGHWKLEGQWVFALNAATGSPRWVNIQDDWRAHGPCVVSADRVGFCGITGQQTDRPCMPPNFRFVFDKKDGRRLGTVSFGVGARQVGEPPLIVQEPKVALPTELTEAKGKVVRAVRAGDAIVVSTETHQILCYGTRPGGAARQHAGLAPSPLAAGADDAPARLVPEADRGYALVAGLKDGAVTESLLAAGFYRVMAVDADAERVDAVRRALDAAGRFDASRLQVLHEDLLNSHLPPYVFSLIVVDDPDATGAKAGAAFTVAAFRSLRPYGGVLALKGDHAAPLRQHVAAAPRERAEVTADGGWTLLRRSGTLPGAEDFDHEYANAANTSGLREPGVRFPLGILWYGGPSSMPDFYMNQSNIDPVKQVVQGRWIMEGLRELGAFDQYTGRLLWRIPMPEWYAFFGVGIHAGKGPNREPWKMEEAFKAEIKPTEHSRQSGFNFATCPDSVYVAASKKLMRIDLATGKVLNAWPMPLPVDGVEPLLWGGLRIAGDLIVATAFVASDLVSGEIGNDGNGGDWAKDRMRMRWLFAVDRKSGDLRWKTQARVGFINSGYAVGGSRVYAVDMLAYNVQAKLAAAGRAPKGPTTVLALDLASGREVWRKPHPWLVPNITYSVERDLLLLPSRHGHQLQGDVWESDAPGGKKKSAGVLVALKGADGSIAYERHEEAYDEPYVLVGDRMIQRYGLTFDARTGLRHVRPFAPTGQEATWSVPRGGCTHLVGSEHFVGWRGGYMDLDHNVAMGAGATDHGCMPTWIVAGGIVNAPNMGGNCTHRTGNRCVSSSMALVHAPDTVNWGVYGRAERGDAVIQPRQRAAVRRLGVNCGAPGDRAAADGTMWMRLDPQSGFAGSYGGKTVLKNLPVVQGNPVVPFQLSPPSVTVSGDALPWVASTGLAGVEVIRIPLVLPNAPHLPMADLPSPWRYRLRLTFLDPDAGAAPGRRVFTVAVQGRPVLNDFDVAKEAGGPRRGIVRDVGEIEVDPKQPALAIEFKARDGSLPPVLCGVEIVGIGP